MDEVTDENAGTARSGTNAGSNVEGDRPPGRPRATTHDELAAVGVALFGEHGYANVSVEQIATAGGVSRRTFFRYFETKADVVWGDFGSEVARLRDSLTLIPDDVPMMTAIRSAVVEFNRVPPEGIAQHRARLRLILTEPDLIARSLLKFEGWRQAIAEFAARRLDVPPTSFAPQLIGEVALAAAVAAYRQWIPRRAADLSACIDAAYATIMDLELVDGDHAARLLAAPLGQGPTRAS